MTIEELKYTHNVLVVNKIDTGGKLHTKLSIEFAIEMLEEIWNNEDSGEDLQSKIQELKQYLDDKS